MWRGSQWGYERVSAIEFGKSNVVIITPGYQEIRYPEELKIGTINPDNFDVFVLKSRVHFRRGFDETGFSPSIFIVDAPGTWFGTTHLEALEYKNLQISDFYPFGKVKYP